MENVKEVRRALGLSQQRLCKLAGVGRARLQAAENNFLELRADELASIGAVLRQRSQSLQRFLTTAFGDQVQRQRPRRRQQLRGRT